MPTDMFLKFDNLDYLHDDLKEELDRRLPSVGWFSDLNLHILLTERINFDKEKIESKIRKIVAKRAEIFEFEFLLVRKRSIHSLFAGFILLTIFLLIAYLLQETESKFLTILSETLIIVVWVAFWKPIEAFLFELPKLKLLYHNYRKLVMARIEIRIDYK